MSEVFGPDDYVNVDVAKTGDNSFNRNQSAESSTWTAFYIGFQL